jgi:hypothetical protein
VREGANDFVDDRGGGGSGSGSGGVASEAALAQLRRNAEGRASELRRLQGRRA